MFVGYSETTKGFRLRDLKDPRQTVTARNVVYIENELYFRKINDRKVRDTPDRNWSNLWKTATILECTLCGDGKV